MIRPTTYGSNIEIVRDDGTLRVVPVYRGRESAAFRTVLAYRRARLLTDHEAGLMLCGLNQLTESSASRSAARCVKDGSPKTSHEAGSVSYTHLRAHETGRN